MESLPEQPNPGQVIDSLATAVQRGLLARGYLVAQRPGHGALRLDPPPGITADDVDGFLAALTDLIDHPAP